MAPGRGARLTGSPASDESAAAPLPSVLSVADDPLPPADGFRADRFGLAPGAGAFADRRSIASRSVAERLGSTLRAHRKMGRDNQSRRKEDSVMETPVP